MKRQTRKEFLRIQDDLLDDLGGVKSERRELPEELQFAQNQKRARLAWRTRRRNQKRKLAVVNGGKKHAA